MVRLKTRYVLFQLMYPIEGGGSVENDILYLKAGSSGAVTPGLLVSILRTSMQKNFGDYGSGMVQTTFSVKYFSPKTGTGIIRCHREAVDHVRAAMFFVSSIDGRPCIFNCVGVSGSIKKAELNAVSRARSMITDAKNMGLLKDEEANTDNILSSIFNKSADDGTIEDE